ncbi:hypothetical protein Ahy_A10g048494 [Arachis hypogaea]|uniref:Protein FAR1-RELATED SEQUENCE n=1 Tax=Arachis hypogaea TaxID=3818 RepID=A0A445B582_ARAHY|nr:hypothetical protein Ahy_A10g048494 [Arachis hypogaea]
MDKIFPKEFERRWHNLISKYRLSENEWLQKTYGTKEIWASSYLNDKFFSRIRTTSQCEGIHSLIKNYISKNCYLLELIHNFNEAMNLYQKNELLSDFKSLFTTPVLTTCLQDIGKQAANVFTKSMFKEVQCEIEKAGKLNVITYLVSNDEVKRQPGENLKYNIIKPLKKLLVIIVCFESRGILCCHIFCTMRHNHIDTILDTILHPWILTLKILLILDMHKKRRDPNSKIFTNTGLVGDPTVVKTKGAPRQNRWATKSCNCSRYTRHGHTIQRCPELYRRNILHIGHH